MSQFDSDSGRAAAKAQARTYSEEEITAGLMAMVAWAGNATKAEKYLREEKGLSIKATTLSAWKMTHGPRFSELREKYSDELEKQMEGELREVAYLAMSVERDALEKAQQKLWSNSDNDPARTASHASRVKQSSIDKLLSLTGRPTTITETRDLPAILRSLVGSKVLRVVGASSTEDDSPEPDAKE